MFELIQADPISRFILRGNSVAGMALLGLTVPTQPCRAARHLTFAALWMGPDEWLLLGASHGDMTSALDNLPHALIDVSHRQLGYRLTGAGADTVLSGAVPLDLSLAAFPVDMCTRTICEKAEIVLWRTGIQEWHIEVARSFAPYMRELLAVIGRANGL